MPAIDVSSFETFEALADPIDDFARDTQLVSAVSSGLEQPLWEVGVGTAILTRGTLAGGPIMVERFPNSGTLLNANQFRFDWTAGPDVSARRVLRDDRYFDAVGLRYFDVQSISANTLVPKLQGVTWAIPAPGSGSEPPIFRNVEAGYTSQLYSFEADAYHGLDGSRMQWLTGFRWTQASDTLGLVGTTPGDQPPVLSTASIASGLGLDSSGSAFFQGALAGLRFHW